MLIYLQVQRTHNNYCTFLFKVQHFTTAAIKLNFNVCFETDIYLIFFQLFNKWMKKELRDIMSNKINMESSYLLKYMLLKKRPFYIQLKLLFQHT